MLRSDMPLQSAPVSPNLVSEVPGNPKWRINQMLVATILGISSRGQMLRIDGNNYTSTTKLDAPPGTRVQLQVTSLAPSIELAVVNQAKPSGVTPSGTTLTPPVVLSDIFLQNTAQFVRQTPPGVSKVLTLIDTLSNQALPPKTAALVATVRERIVSTVNITNPEALKAALQDASIVLAGVMLTDKGSSKASGLTLLLQQIVASLTPDKAMPGRDVHPIAGREAAGLALYKSVNRTVAETANRLASVLLPRLATELDDEILRLFAGQQQSPDEINDYAYRWVYELPVNFQERIRSIAVRIYKEKSTRGENDPDASWSATFAFELEHSGCVQVTLFIVQNRVSVTLHCEHATVARKLDDNQELLQEGLAVYGLQLASLRLQKLYEEQLHTMLHRDNRFSREAGKLALQEFKMQHNSRNMHYTARIPDVVYCGMAALFSYILKFEDTLL